MHWRTLQNKPATIACRAFGNLSVSAFKKGHLTNRTHQGCSNHLKAVPHPTIEEEEAILKRLLDAKNKPPYGPMATNRSAVNMANSWSQRMLGTKRSTVVDNSQSCAASMSFHE